MSTENLHKCQEAVMASPELQAKIAAIQAEQARAGAEKISVLSTEAGTTVSVEELLDAATANEGELSDEQLDTLAGGNMGASFFLSYRTWGSGCGGIGDTASLIAGDLRCSGS